MLLLQELRLFVQEYEQTSVNCLQQLTSLVFRI